MGEDEAYTKEETVIPEARITKWEIVDSFVNACNNLAIFFKYRQLGKTNNKVFSNFKRYVLELYFKVPEAKNDQIDKYLYDNIKISNNDWIKCFFKLKKIIYDLGIINIKIEKKYIKKNKAFLDL